MDTLVLANTTGGTISGFRARAGERARCTAQLRADGVPLAELGRVRAARLAAGRRARTPASMRPARASARRWCSTRPRATYASAASRPSSSRSPAATPTSGRSCRRTCCAAAGRSSTRRVDYPIALTLFSAKPTGDSLRGRIHADSVDLALVEALSAKLRNATGRMAIDLAISGAPTQAAPGRRGRRARRRGGDARRRAAARGDGRAGPHRRDARLAGDRPSAVHDAGERTARPSCTGAVVFRDKTQSAARPSLRREALRAVDKRNRRAARRVDRCRRACGSTAPSTRRRCSGALLVDRGTIYIPELVRKELEEITLDDFAMLFDTTDVRNRSLMPAAPSKLVEHLRLAGVSVNLGRRGVAAVEGSEHQAGRLAQRHPRPRRAQRRQRRVRRRPVVGHHEDRAQVPLALSGTLSADRGTYRLDLGIVQREFQVQSGKHHLLRHAGLQPGHRRDGAVPREADQPRRHPRAGPHRRQLLSAAGARAHEHRRDRCPQSDLVSYLATGRPAVGARQLHRQRRAARVDILAPT